MEQWRGQEEDGSQMRYGGRLDRISLWLRDGGWWTQSQSMAKSQVLASRNLRNNWCCHSLWVTGEDKDLRRKNKSRVLDKRSII